MSNDDICNLMKQRIYNASLGINYGPILKKVLRITVYSFFTDGLLAVKPYPGKPLRLVGKVKQINIDIRITT